jgi:hypothetical protein
MLTKDFHPSQLLFVTETKRTAKYGNAAALTLGISLCVVTVLPSHWSSKLSNVAIASALFYLSHKLEKLQKWSDEYSHTSAQQSVIGYRDHLSSSFAPPRREVAIAPPVESPAPITVSDIKKALSKPHILVLGETGSGKSTLVKFLVSHAAAPSIVLDSHAAPDDWQNMNVIGMGRNYRAIGEAVSQLVAFMDTRYQARSQGQKQFEPLLVLIDEFPAAAANLGKAFTDNIMLLVREARKVSIRLIILSQGSEVKTLGIEGQGSIRECFAIVAIGKFATDRAKALKDEQIKHFIESAQYPAMLDDLPCELPKIDRVSLPSLPLPIDYQALLTNSIADTKQPDFATVDTPSTLVSTSAQSKLSAPLQAILDYARKQDEFVSARKIQSSIRIFRDTSAPEIRQYFQWLADKNYGVVRGADDNLEFSAS